jgi:TetR/AcrR family transcriptional repressor of nem operon
MNGDARLAARDKIITAAGQLVASRRAADAILDGVRRAAGVTPGQLREHFADKAAVPTGTCEVAGIVPESPMDRALRKVDSIDALRAWAELYVEQLPRDDFHGGCVLGALAGPLASAEPATRAEIGAALVRRLDDLARALRIMRDRGELCPEADPKALASSLLAMLLGGILLAKTRRDIAPLRSAVAAMVSSVRSLAAAEGPERPSPNDRIVGDHVIRIWR